MTSLDPTMTIGKQIMEGMIWHFKTPKKEAWDRAVHLLEEVGITDAEKRIRVQNEPRHGAQRQLHQLDSVRQGYAVNGRVSLYVRLPRGHTVRVFR